MSDLRALLHDPWCPKCRRAGSHITEVHNLPKSLGGDGPEMNESEVPPLTIRMPEAVPAGLKWAAANVAGGNWKVNASWITDEQAELLFIGNAVKVLADATDADKVVIISPATIAQFAAALHKLADERDAAKETKKDWMVEAEEQDASLR